MQLRDETHELCPTQAGHRRGIGEREELLLLKGVTARVAELLVRSGYRSYATQKAVYEHALRNYPSEASAKAYNAPPGASEHQTGLSMDLWDGVTWSLPMANTATGKWLHKHCHEFGFILQKGSDLVGPVNVALAAMKADGYIDALNRKWLFEYSAAQ